MRRSNRNTAYQDTFHPTSPIVGALLMVAITVLFVAVLGTFSFGLAYGATNNPQASLSTQLDVPNDRVTIIHMGGEALPGDRTRIAIVNESDGRQIELSPVEGSAGAFEVGDKVFIDTSTGSLDGWSLDPDSTTFELRGGITYTISVVDTKSELVIYRTSLTTT